MRNFFKRKYLQSSIDLPKEFKFLNLNGSQERGISALLNRNFSFDFSLLYYENVFPVMTGVNLITDEFASLDLYLSDGTNLTKDAPIIGFLDKELNPDKKRTEFLKEYSAFYEITGNAFLIAKGAVNKEPVSLDVISPLAVNIVSFNPQGYPNEYLVNLRNSQSIRFKAVNDLNGKVRYFNISENAGGLLTTGDVLNLDPASQPTMELSHVKDFSPRSGQGSYYGMSSLNAVRPEIDQYLTANTHNLSLLLKGGFFSGVVSAPEVNSEEQMSKLKMDLQNCYSGSVNAGKLFVTNADIKYQATSMKNADMNFVELKTDNKIAIFQALKIPLPLVMPGSQTLNNYQESKYMLYDLAVLPLANKLLEELTAFIGPRFGLADNEFITYNPYKIPALQGRFNKLVLEMKDANIYSDNEMRAVGGWKPYPQGDTIYKPANLVPVGEDDDLSDNSVNSN